MMNVFQKYKLLAGTRHSWARKLAVRLAWGLFAGLFLVLVDTYLTQRKELVETRALLIQLQEPETSRMMGCASTITTE
jgi:hypothetical protein